MMAAIVRLAYLALGTVATAAAACNQPSGDLRDRVVSTDHYEETIGQGKAVGDVQVTLDPRRDRVTIGFAPPAASWVDSRPLHFPEPPPQAAIARAGCTLTVTPGDDAATVAAGQACGALRVTRGKVWIERHVLQIEIYGTLDGAAYRFVFPILIGSDYALPID